MRWEVLAIYLGQNQTQVQTCFIVLDLAHEALIEPMLPACSDSFLLPKAVPELQPTHTLSATSLLIFLQGSRIGSRSSSLLNIALTAHCMP